MSPSRMHPSHRSTFVAIVCSLLTWTHIPTAHAAPRRPELTISGTSGTAAGESMQRPALEAPEAEEDEAARSAALDLGTRRAAGRLLTRAPSVRQREAADGRGARRLLWPVEGGSFVRGFGFVRKVRKDLPHLGVDIAAPPGTPIHAAADGIVGYADDGVKGYGNLVILVHADGAVTSYAHCRKLYVTPGQRVLRGTVVGEVGSTGISKGPHLHFEYRRRGRPRNPMARFDRPTTYDPARLGVASAARH